MKNVSGNLVSEIKFGKLEEVLTTWQNFGMTFEDFRNLRKDHSLALEVFRLIRDQTIFRNKRYTLGYEWEEQKEKFQTWNKELNLGIPDADFNTIIIRKSPIPPVSDRHNLYCTCLVYEFGDPLETLLNGLRILDYELLKINGYVKFEQDIGGIFKEKDGKLYFPEKIPPEIVRFRPEAPTRKKGFRFVVIELGRAKQFPQMISAKDGWEYFKNYFHWCEELQIKNVGQELPYIAAMYPGWITSVCADSLLYPRPLALDIQADFIHKYEIKFYPKSCGCLCLHEYVNSDYPAYGKNKPFAIEATDFPYEYKRNSVLGRGYGICTIISES